MLQANYFDGRSTRVRSVDLSLSGEDLIVIGEDVDLRIPFARVQVDERLGRAPRRLRLEDGTFFEVRDSRALDRLLSAVGHRDGWVDTLQRRLPLVLLALVGCAMCAVAAYRWGLPSAAATGARHLSPVIGKTLSAQALKVLDAGILLPSTISEDDQRRLNAAFHAMRLPEGGTPRSALLFRRSPQLGANAFTLPDGTIIVLDDLITALGDDQQTLAVLAHELGHAHGRHGLQMLLRTSAVGAFLTFYVGDISTLLAAAPAAVVEARYSQEFERQADDYAAALLLHNEMSPGLLADALTKLAQLQPALSKGGYLASHPATDERIRRLRLPAPAAGAK